LPIVWYGIYDREVSDNELLNKIKQNWIIKIRIQFGNEFFEKKWKKDELGKFINKSQIKIEEQLNKLHSSTKSIELEF
jgi:hypothetical protein